MKTSITCHVSMKTVQLPVEEVAAKGSTNMQNKIC